jgi:hypothetical protein
MTASRLRLTTIYSQTQSHVTSDSQSWNKAPVWGLGLDIYYCQTVACLFMWGALSDERMFLSFKMYNI